MTLISLICSLLICTDDEEEEEEDEENLVHELCTGQSLRRCKLCPNGGSDLCEHGRQKCGKCADCGDLRPLMKPRWRYGVSTSLSKVKTRYPPGTFQACAHKKFIGHCKVCVGEAAGMLLCKCGNDRRTCSNCGTRIRKTEPIRKGNRHKKCSHGKPTAYKCVQCGGKGLCEHGRLKQQGCTDCGVWKAHE